jgi:hypothetical protein
MDIRNQTEISPGNTGYLHVTHAMQQWLCGKKQTTYSTENICYVFSLTFTHHKFATLTSEITMGLCWNITFSFSFFFFGSLIQER